MKLAFIHTPKCAGTFVRVYIDEVLEKMGCGNAIFDPNFPANEPEVIQERFGHIPHFGGRSPKKDWDEDQLNYILGYERSINTEHSFIHNHAINWPNEIHRKYREAGWKTFTFVRALGQVMCSYYFYIKNQAVLGELNGNKGKPNHIVYSDGWNLNVWGAPYSIIKKITLDEFLQIMLKHNDTTRKKFYIPNYWKSMDFVAPYSGENFEYFLGKYLNHDFEGKIPSHGKNLADRGKEKLLISGNKGYEHYCNTGEVSKKTQKLIQENRRQKIFEEVVEKNNLK